MTRTAALLAAVLLAAALVAPAPAAAQDAARCHIDIVDRTRNAAELDIRNTGTGRCRYRTEHRCGQALTMRRVLVIDGTHRAIIAVDCGPLRLRALTAQVTTR
jgi:hypothetical protein